MKLNIKLCITTLVVLMTTAIFYSCKKTATNETKGNEELLKQFAIKNKNEPQISTQVVNLKGTAYYGDIDGNKITPGQVNKGLAYTCPDPGNSEITQTLVSITREFTCGVGYRFVVQYEIISEFELLYGNGSGLYSRGRIKLLNGTTQVYISPTSPVNPVISIVDNGVVGQNSNGDDLNEFLVTYRSEIISEATYNQSNSVQSNLFMYTNCPNYATITIPFSGQQSVSGSQHNSLPCTRIDKVYWNPSSGLGASTAGCNAVPGSCFPWGYVFPDRHQIEIYVNSQWQAIQLWRFASGGGTETPATAGLISPIDVWYISMTGYSGSPSTISAGTYSVRYRNKETDASNGGPCETQPSNTWITESWYISI